jgi:hypothetical protein
VTSPESQKLIQLFYTACNTQNVDRFQRAVNEFSQLKAEERLGAREIVAFQKIIRLAEGSHWDEAAAASLAFAEDQVR